MTMPGLGRVSRGPAPVDHHGRAGDQARGRRGQEDDAPRNVHRITDPVEAGDALSDVGFERRITERPRGAVGPDERRGHRVDRDPMRDPTPPRGISVKCDTAAFVAQ